MTRGPGIKPPSPTRLAKLREGDKAAERKLLDDIMARLDRGEIKMADARRMFREETAERRYV